MTYTPPRTRAGAGWTDGDRARVGQLEQVSDPSPMQRGELAALRIRATGGDADRAATLTTRWEGSR